MSFRRMPESSYCMEILDPGIRRNDETIKLLDLKKEVNK